MSKSAQAKHTLLLYSSAVVIPLVLLVILATFARNTVDSLENARLLVDRTFILKRDLALLLRAVVDVETGQRGFILTQREEFLDPYNYAVSQIPVVEKRIEETILDPTARNLFQKLKSAVAARMKFSDEVIGMQRRGDHDQTVARVSTGEGKNLMDEVRARSEALDKRQDVLLSERQEQHRQSALLSERASWLLIVLDVIFVGAVIFLLTHLRRAQALLRVCAWSQTVEYEGEWLSYEEYILRRFGVRVTHGISPAEAEKMFSKKKQVAAA